jgi:hypothetical protein
MKESCGATTPFNVMLTGSSFQAARLANSLEQARARVEYRT